MPRVFIVLVYKKCVSCRCSNGPTAQSMCMDPGRSAHARKTQDYSVCRHQPISELEDYGTMPADPATSNCDLRNVHGYSSAMSLMLVGNVKCCFASKVNLLYLL